CFGHIVQLACKDFMAQITQVAIAENKQAIWDYNPSDPQSPVNGGLDVISVIRMLIVKVCAPRSHFLTTYSFWVHALIILTQIQASGQWKQAFEEFQNNGTSAKPLALIMHNNTRWGSAFGMTRRVYHLQKVREHPAMRGLHPYCIFAARRHICAERGHAFRPNHHHLQER
ncbi:hypothetical protein LXA43DRAFT_878230, partial [Ganoderma leucocontextum]